MCAAIKNPSCCVVRCVCVILFLIAKNTKQIVINKRIYYLKVYDEEVMTETGMKPWCLCLMMVAKTFRHNELKAVMTFHLVTHIYLLCECLCSHI